MKNVKIKGSSYLQKTKFGLLFSFKAILLLNLAEQSVGALGELLINNMYVATSWDGF